MPNYQLHLSLHLMFMMIAGLLHVPDLVENRSRRRAWTKCRFYDLSLAVLSARVCLYWVFFYPEICDAFRRRDRLDLIIGGLGILLVLEATRRTVGIALSIIAGCSSYTLTWARTCRAY